MKTKNLLILVLVAFLAASVNAQTAVPVKWIAAPTAEIINISIPSCNGENDGSAEVIVTSGTAPYSYQWSNGQITPIATGLHAGTHTVTVTDANCETVVEVNITEPTELVIISSITNVHPDNPNSGSISLVACGGTGPLNYLWSTGEITPTISNLVAGTYQVTVSDANGCMATKTINVYSDPLPIDSAVYHINIPLPQKYSINENIHWYNSFLIENSIWDIILSITLLVIIVASLILVIKLIIKYFKKRDKQN